MKNNHFAKILSIVLIIFSTIYIAGCEARTDFSAYRDGTHTGGAEHSHSHGDGHSHEHEHEHDHEHEHENEHEHEHEHEHAD